MLNHYITSLLVLNLGDELLLPTFSHS